MIKVALLTKALTLAGIGTVIENYCDALPADKYEIYILAGSNIAPKYTEKYKGSNVTIVPSPSKGDNPRGYYKAINQFLKENKIDVVHMHGNSAMCLPEMMIAWHRGVKKRVMHCHNTMSDHVGIHKILKPFFNLFCTDRIACGEDAGHWLYGKRQFTVLPNAFDVERFRFNQTSRDKVRAELGIGDQTVIGHVGRFAYQKNQAFLLEIYEAYLTTDPDAVLLFVGQGEDLEAVKARAKKGNVIFYGITEKTEEMYCAMDCFVFPSRFEGLPIVLQEAQLSGLPCVVSDAVTQEGYLGGDVVWLSLNDDPKTWAEKVHVGQAREQFIENHADQVGRYRIENTVGILERIYG